MTARRHRPRLASVLLDQQHRQDLAVEFASSTNISDTINGAINPNLWPGAAPRVRD